MADDELVPCAAAISFCRPELRSWMDEPEGARVPAGLRVFDSHVHLFPPRVFHSIWRWFDKNAWGIRYHLQTEQVIEFLASRGVSRFVALHYSHKPGMAAVLNQFVADASRGNPQIVPFATVMPGEPDAKEVLRDAFGRLGLRGVKLQCHVQQMPADDPRMLEVYEVCQDAGRPVVIHSGREPSFPAYGVDTRALCGADQIDRVLKKFPRLTLVVPHLGADEFSAYEALLDQHEHLYLDTTMAISDAFTQGPPASLFPGRASRLLYGTDFPNLPYAWDRELKKLTAIGMSAADQHAILSGNAEKLFS
jgi:predicted TIM-barrel fold metal-dependent hydrolase